jgi:hypothetical protein
MVAGVAVATGAAAVVLSVVGLVVTLLLARTVMHRLRETER